MKSYVVIQGRIAQAETFPTKADAARFLNGRDVWIVDRCRDRYGDKMIERIVPAVLSDSRPAEQAYVYRDHTGREVYKSRHVACYPTFSAAKKHLVDTAKNDLRSALREARVARSDLRQARAHRKPKGRP